MEFMQELPDKFFDLAICDPPYGLDSKLRNGGNTGVVKFKHFDSSWDNKPPSGEYFKELKRVSENQIIWGANYFWEHLSSTRGIIIWDKLKENNRNFSHFEFAWTSFDKMAMKFSFGGNSGFALKAEDKNRIHATQKPVSLYRWLLENYASKGDKIFDTHLGSGSSRIAAYKLGFDFWGCEIDAEYFEKSEKRFRESISMPLFDGIDQSQTSLF